MAYTIRKSDGTVLSTIADGVLDTSNTSLTLIGKNVSNFGEAQNSNIVHLLENFASITEPVSPLTGQIWFDKNSYTLKVYNGNLWVTLATVAVSADSADAATTGSLWFDTVNQQLSVNTGNGLTTIGPEIAHGFEATRMVSATIVDSTSTVRPIIKCVLDDEVIYIISRAEFDILPAAAIPGFTRIYRGITFKNADSADVHLYGKSEFTKNADLLKGATGEFITPTIAADSNTLVQRDNNGNIAVNRLLTNAVDAVNDGVLSGAWSVDRDFTPVTTDSLKLGTAEKTWYELNAQTVRSTTMSASVVKFTTLTDGAQASITKFDADPALTASSNSSLPTQRAVKEYVDSLIQQEIQNRLSGDAALQTVINGLETIPAGTVFYTAATSAPSGFLIPAGQYVSKNTYPRLYAAIGNTYGSTDTTFRLPDLRGEFIRSADLGRGVDVARQTGTVQQQSFPKHFHGTGQFSARGDDWFEAILRPWTGFTHAARYCSGDERWGTAPILTITGSTDEYIATATTDNIGDTGEVRPRNIALVPIMKY